MNMNPKYMWLIFAAAFGGLWLIGLLAAKYLGRRSLTVFIGGDDDRLSLSKMQAFAWTFIVMSSYFAAMAVHTKFTPEQNWIEIPDRLLALMGIVIGSAGISSVISAVKEERRTAEVTKLEFKEDVLTITGKHLGQNWGAVRIVAADRRRWEVSVSHWEDTEVQVIVDSTLKSKLIHRNDDQDKTKTKTPKERNTLIVDTQNGKACYRFDFDGTTASNLVPIINYEFVDLFRDDQNPSVLSIMKYQMLAWTIIAVVIYVYVFVTNGAANLTKLPVLNEKLVILTGLSQAGYLGGKAAPKLPPR